MSENNSDSWIRVIELSLAPPSLKDKQGRCGPLDKETKGKDRERRGNRRSPPR